MAVMKGVAPNMISTLATGARPSARMKLDETSGEQNGAEQQGWAAITHIDQDPAAPRRSATAAWRRREGPSARTTSSHAGKVDPPHDDTRRAENRRGNNGAQAPRAGRNLAGRWAFSSKPKREYGPAVPPSIDSSICRPSSHAFRGGGGPADHRHPTDLCSRLAISPHTRASAWPSPMADRTGDILLGMLDNPMEPVEGRPLDSFWSTA